MSVKFSGKKIPKDLIKIQTEKSVVFSNPSPFKNEDFGLNHNIAAPISQKHLLSDLDEEELFDVFIQVREFVKQKPNSDFTINSQNGVQAGNDTGNFHIHIVERSADDGIPHLYVLNKKYLKVNFNQN